MREKRSLSQGEIALPFGKRTVRENRRSCKAKSRGEKNASGGLVVAQRGAGVSRASDVVVVKSFRVGGGFAKSKAAC